MDSSDPKEMKVGGGVVESRHARSLNQVTASRPGHRGRGASPLLVLTKQKKSVKLSSAILSGLIMV